ncbi:hypothetical protein AGMMS4957_16310 [Bacteroidia bacterium]|nr:hypothetical protein AGMMS4957_16310 [Bacteroidia bacterium]
MEVTELGMVTDVKPIQLRKASYPMAVTEQEFTVEGITTAPEYLLSEGLSTTNARVPENR